MNNQKHTPSVNYQRDRLSYLWFALGTVFLLFTMPNWAIPFAAWLAPIFLLRFVRTQPLLLGMLLVPLSSFLVLAIALRGVLPLSGVFYYTVTFAYGFIITLPYLLDRVLAPRLGGLLGSIVFPLAVTTVWYLLALNPYGGTMVNPAYSQYNDLPLMQLVSVTGLWGIILLISWLASVANWAWEQGFTWSKVRAGLLLYGGLLALVLLGGGARLTFLAPQGATVRVAGVTALHYHELLPEGNFGPLLDEKTTEAQRQATRPVLARVDENLLMLSQQEARAGAKMVIWPESGATVLQEDEAAFVQQAQSVAHASGIYLNMGLAVVLPSQQPPYGRDESVLIDPSGHIVWVYQKAHPTADEQQRLAPGNGQVPTAATPYGRLATSVCFDRDFLDIIHRVGQANADIMLVPTGDWREIDPYHSQMAAFEAIEVGSSLIIQADRGLSMAVDYEGRVLASTDFYSTDPQVMVAYIPIQGVHTIYATIGDLFAWLSIAGLGVLIGVALVRRRKTGEAEAATPSEEPLSVS